MISSIGLESRKAFLEAFLLYNWKENYFISGPYPILVLTMVLCRPHRNHAKSDIFKKKNYQGSTTSRENMIRKYVNFSTSFFKF